MTLPDRIETRAMIAEMRSRRGDQGLCDLMTVAEAIGDQLDLDETGRRQLGMLIDELHAALCGNN